jgi:hypothetical protein
MKAIVLKEISEIATEGRPARRENLPFQSAGYLKVKQMR